ncbi:protein LURP-one-related 15-like [Aegilops tauschii subsp. strangulata]|uniref:Protein LURP-one-related 15 n=1 Tax=Aegilops tauschii subsp. strangulata TaxID=200361 RepID=A0A453M8H6_AEGTS|nr:protein LURP-one-related 15-like [Aegilops tauschii subsp. strangulata]
MSGEPAEATPAVVVVGSRFCAPAATAFAVTKTISVTGRDFTVTDAHGAAVMQVEAAVFSFLQHRSLLLDAASRRPVLTLQDSTYLASTRWEAYRGDSTSRRNLLFVAVKTAPVQLARTKVRLFLAGNGSGERVPDFVIGVCTVSAGGGGGDDSDGNIVARISRQNTAGGAFLGRHTYTARINPGVDQAFILALTVILDQMHH